MNRGAEEPLTNTDIAKVRSYFDERTNERVSDERIADNLHWFRRDSQRHMLAARSIVKSLEPT